MNKKKIELQVQNISNSQAQAGAFAMVLREVGGNRHLPVIIGASEAQAMLIELRKIIPPRPMTHNLFASVLEVLSVKLLRTLIYKAENGIFYSYLYLKAEESIIRVDARTSDAVTLALRMDAPIFIYEDILEAECLKTEEESTAPAGSTKPILEESPELLKAALQKAIEDEDYEHAALLRDRIRKLENE